MPANIRREARRKAGFRTQANFAEWLGLAQSTVANWESGWRKTPVWYDKVVDLKAENIELRRLLRNDVLKSFKDEEK